MKRVFFTLLITSIVLLQACTNKKLIIGTWKFTKAEAIGSDGSLTNVLANNPACAKDNLVIFEENNVFRLDEGANACPEPVTDTGTWFIDDKETEVISLVDGEVTRFDIIEITKTTAVFTQKTDIDSDGIDDTLTLTLTREEE